MCELLLSERALTIMQKSVLVPIEKYQRLITNTGKESRDVGIGTEPEDRETSANKAEFEAKSERQQQQRQQQPQQQLEGLDSSSEVRSVEIRDKPHLLTTHTGDKPHYKVSRVKNQYWSRPPGKRDYKSFG